MWGESPETANYSSLSIYSRPPAWKFPWTLVPSKHSSHESLYRACHHSVTTRYQMSSNILDWICSERKDVPRFLLHRNRKGDIHSYFQCCSVFFSAYCKCLARQKREASRKTWPAEYILISRSIWILNGGCDLWSNTYKTCLKYSYQNPNNISICHS